MDALIQLRVSFSPTKITYTINASIPFWGFCVALKWEEEEEVEVKKKDFQSE